MKASPLHDQEKDDPFYLRAFAKTLFWSNDKARRDQTGTRSTTR
jgi:hypothetical protein